MGVSGRMGWNRTGLGRDSGATGLGGAQAGITFSSGWVYVGVREVLWGDVGGSIRRQYA